MRDKSTSFGRAKNRMGNEAAWQKKARKERADAISRRKKRRHENVITAQMGVGTQLALLIKKETTLHIEQAQRISAAQCAGVLAALSENYDFVVLDGPVRLDHSAQAVFPMTDLYLVVLQLLVPPVRNTDRLLRELGHAGYNLDHVRLVCNRYGRESGYLVPCDVETTLGHRLAWTLPDDWKTASTAINSSGRPCGRPWAGAPAGARPAVRPAGDSLRPAVVRPGERAVK